MKQISIQLPNHEAVQTFVSLVNQFPYSVDLVRGNYRVDAKSIMGIFSLNFQEPVTCEIAETDCADLIAALEPFRLDP